MFLPGLVVPTATFPKPSEAGERLTGSVPEPVRATVCGLLLALSLMLTVPVCGPPTVGVNVTVIVHDPSAGRLAPQVLTWVKAAEPMIVMLMPVSATL